jgi:ABC-type nitrate/sulfonate/bicarbonate transport system substrate-binding protein
MIKFIVLTLILFNTLFASNYIKPILFEKKISNLKVQPVSKNYYMPVITWADVILALDNEKIFPKGIKLVDDPTQQIKDLISGKTPFIRQTLGSAIMIDSALKDKGIHLVAFHSLSDSLGGDVIIAKNRIKNLNTLKEMIKSGKKPVVSIQWGGPHMGWLIQMLESIGAGINDIEIKYCKNLFGDDSPESAIAEDSSIDLAFVISLSASNLTVGEHKIPNLHILTTTKVNTKAIKDLIYVRDDWAKENPSKLKEIRTTYFKSLEKLNDTSLIKKGAKLLFGGGEQAINDLIAMRDETKFHDERQSNNFFYNDSNFVNFDRKSIQIATAYKKAGYIPNDAPNMKKYDWKAKISKTNIITKLTASDEAIVAKKVKRLDDKGQGQEIFKELIFFKKPNQSIFQESEYSDYFDKVIKLSAVYGGAVIKIVGNVDPQLLRAWNKAIEFKKQNNKNKLLKVENYFKEQTGAKINLMKMSIQKIITERNNIQSAAQRNSKQRANAVKQAIINYANKKNLNLNAARLVVIGYGADNPIYEKPTNKREFMANMRADIVITNYNSEISEFNKAQDF